MIRAISWIIALAALVAVSVWLAERPGTVTFNWQGWRVDTSVGFLVFAVALVAALAAGSYRGWLFVRRAPRQLGSYRRANRQQRGFRALTQGMVAVAAGDASEASRQAKRADSLLSDPPLTMLLSAQAAQLNGDDDAARGYFDAMLERQETAFLGLRGLLMQAQREGDDQAALGYARRAYAMRPKTPWVLPALFDLQVKQGSWVEALASLEEAIRRKAVGADEGRRRRVVVLLGCSVEAAMDNNPTEALSYARKAYNQSPEFLPATIRVVGLMVEGGKLRPASRIIHNAWTREPHPELARVYDAIAPSDDALKKVRRIEKLIAFNPDHAESHIALAAAALEAALWGTARNHLERAAGDAPSARVCRMLSDLENAEHGDAEAARSWLLRAATADPDPAWVCGSCAAAAPRWHARCERCGELGSLAWGVPETMRRLGGGQPPAASLGAPAAASPSAAGGTADDPAGEAADDEEEPGASAAAGRKPPPENDEEDEDAPLTTRSVGAN